MQNNDLGDRQLIKGVDSGVHTDSMSNYSMQENTGSRLAQMRNDSVILNSFDSHGSNFKQLPKLKQ